MSNPQLFSGVQLLHKNNHVHTTREGYANIDDYMNTTELTYSGAHSEFYNLNPGLYKIEIDGTMYALMLHDTLSGGNKLVVDKANKAYTVINFTFHKIPMYIFHEGNNIEASGYALLDSVNDHISLLIVDGETRCKAGNSVSMEYPGLLEFISIMNIRINTLTLQDNYTLNMKNYLKRIDFGDRKVYDTMYLDAEADRSTFIFRTEHFTLTGYENIEWDTELSNQYVNVFKYHLPDAKANALVKCSHLPTIKWELMEDKDYINEGIAINLSSDRCIYFKVPVSEFKDLDSFVNEVRRIYKTSESEERFRQWLKARHEAEILGLDPDLVPLHSIVACPFTIVYELNTPIYRNILLDNYKINTYFNKCWLTVDPYVVFSDYTIEQLDGLMGLEPRDGKIKSVSEQELESDTKSYQEIIAENKLWIGLIVEYINEITRETQDINRVNRLSFTENMSVRDTSFSQSVDENNLWRNSLLNTTSPYETMNRFNVGNLLAENNIFEDIIVSDYTNIVAVEPYSGIIPWLAEQIQQSGNSDKYQEILNNNRIWRLYDVILSGDVNIRTMYFYKHLKVS